MKNVSLKLAIGFAGLCARITEVQADEFNHHYRHGDKVNFYVHKVRPFRLICYGM
jgi:hypothetical protein